MIFTDDQVRMLSAKLDSRNVASRQQAGRSLNYIEGWHAIAEANRIFGFDGWTRETVEMRQVVEAPRKIGQQQREGWSVAYTSKVRVTVRGVVREGVGYGSGIDVDLGSAHESAIKEAETDAMKRALMTFGNPFGLALYDKSQENVEHVEERSQPSDWEAVAYDIRSQIDAAKTAGELGDILESRNFADLEKHSVNASTFLRDRANKRAASFAQAPHGRAA